MRGTVAALTLFAALALVAMPAGAQYQINESVIGSGGGSASGGSYSIVGTVGQPAIGVTSGGSYINEIGFWYQPGWVLTGVEEELFPAFVWPGVILLFIEALLAAAVFRRWP